MLSSLRRALTAQGVHKRPIATPILRTARCPRYNRPVTSDSGPNARWTKDKAGATLAATTGFFFTLGPARETAKQLTREYAYTAASLASLAVAVLTYWIGLRVMRKLP